MFTTSTMMIISTMAVCIMIIGCCSHFGVKASVAVSLGPMVAHSKETTHRNPHPLMSNMLLRSNGVAYNIKSVDGDVTNRARRCGICGKKWTAKDFRVHCKVCNHFVFLQDPASPMTRVKKVSLGSGGLGVDKLSVRYEQHAFGFSSLPGFAGTAGYAHIAATAPPEMHAKLAGILTVGKPIWNAAAPGLGVERSKDHVGKLWSWGFTRIGQKHHAYDELHDQIRDLFSLCHDLFMPLLPDNMVVQAPKWGMVNCDLSEGYQPKPANMVNFDRSEGYQLRENNHLAPQPLATMLNMDGCLDIRFGCKTCRTRGCLHCTDCVMQCGRGEKELCYVYQYQPEDTPKEEMAYFNIGNHSYPMRGGLLTCFVGGVTPHGAWAPKEMKPEHMHRGFAFVRRCWL